MSTTNTVSAALDSMFERPTGLYGDFGDLPIIATTGHERRVELLDRLEIGDVTDMAVADFGMGSWGFGSVYPKIQHCARAVGFDISNSAIRLSKELVKSTRPPYADCFDAYQSDGMDLPIVDNSIDLFFSGESIEHVKFPLRFLSEIYRVLKQDGQLVITTPNRHAIRYYEKGEEYCASPEHFWLFNYQELIDTVSVFFDIQECYGFNGSFGSYIEDREVKDRILCEEWSRQFEHEPHLATGIVLKARKKHNIDFYYEIEDIPSDRIIKPISQTYLDLEFGLKGLLLNDSDEHVRILRPASDGVVCRFWAHRWSGETCINTQERSDVVDLYSYDPGWKVWECGAATDHDTVIQIHPNKTKNPKAEASQVLFFEAFTWKIVSRADASRSATVPGAGSTSATKLEPAAPVVGYGFAKFQRFVGTTVFHWFTANEGNVRGPWQPLGGRASWTGDVAFWRKQIKEIMLANIDAIYLHLIEQYEESRLTFFQAYAQLRQEGYDVPKVAPFIDPNILFAAAPIDVATEAGRDEYCRHFIRFYKQYFEYNTDEHAASFLLTVDDRLVLTSWWAYWLLQNLEMLTAEDVVTRLKKALQDKIPQLNAGVYMMSTSLIDPDYAFSEERMIMFSGYAYAMHSVHKGVDVWHVQPGYWDQNIRKPGYFLPRDGGKNYRRAWDAVISALPQVHRVYVESWNEYDEGSGIYAADPDGLFADQAMHRNVDIFSDTGNPYEYVLTTAEGASRFNGKPEVAGIFLRHDAPARVKCGEVVSLAFLVRNEGNLRWIRDGSIGLAVRSSGQHVGAAQLVIHGDEAGFERSLGLPRGFPTLWTARVRAPDVGGMWPLTVDLTRDGAPVGTQLELSIVVVAAD